MREYLCVVLVNDVTRHFRFNHAHEKVSLFENRDQSSETSKSIDTPGAGALAPIDNEMGLANGVETM